jgi:hypothetical protein
MWFSSLRLNDADVADIKDVQAISLGVNLAITDTV